MKTLQNKAFWRRKRAVLENQLFHVENRTEIGRHRHRPNVTPVVVSANNQPRRESDRIAPEMYRYRY